MKKHHCALFDLDGVVVDTAKYHYLAWKKIASEVGYELTHQDNEQLKGVSRPDSLKIILKMANSELSHEDFDRFLLQKNKDYLELNVENGVYQMFELNKSKDFKHLSKSTGICLVLK